MADEIKDLFGTLLNVPPEEINGGTSPETLEAWDSMQHLILVSGFEEEFGIEIEPEETVEMYKDYRTFESIIKQKIDQTR